jgi:hypothetical protein
MPRAWPAGLAGGGRISRGGNDPEDESADERKSTKELEHIPLLPSISTVPASERRISGLDDYYSRVCWCGDETMSVEQEKAEEREWLPGFVLG